MTALAKRSPLPLIAAIAAALSIGGALALRFLLKYLKKVGETNKRRKARQALLAARPKDAPAPKVQHVVMYALPDLKDGSEPRNRLGGIVEKMNTAFPCVTAAFANYGSGSMGKQALLGFLGKPDMSLFMTHCMVITADDPMALKLMLHSNLHKGEYYATGGPFCRGILEMVVDLGIDLDPTGKEDPMLEIVFLRFKPEVTDDSEIYQTFLKAVAEFNKSPGVAACLRPAGYHGMIKEDLLGEIQWSADSFIGTHCLTVAADSPQQLKDLMNSEAYGNWLKTEMPYLVQDGIPPAVIFFAPLKIKNSA